MILEINEEEKDLLIHVLAFAEGDIVGTKQWAVLGPKVEALEAKIRALQGPADQFLSGDEI